MDGVQSTADQRIIIREYHFYISDDRSHSAHFVQHCFHLHDNFVMEQGITKCQRWIWSDGCVSQFKSARQFLWLYEWHRHTNVEIIWSFFETGHGKGEHDGAGACIKRALRRHQLRHESERFRDAKDVVEWCTSHMSVDSSSSETEQSQSRRVRRFFSCVHSHEINTSGSDCATVKGTLKLHSIRSTNYANPCIYTRCHACFCDECIDGTWENCQNKAWVDGWKNTV